MCLKYMAEIFPHTIIFVGFEAEFFFSPHYEEPWKKPNPVANDDTEEQPVLESLLEFISVFFSPLSLFRMRSNRFAVCESEKKCFAFKL